MEEAHQASPSGSSTASSDGEDDSASSGSEDGPDGEDASGSDVSESASVGGAIKVEPPAGDRVSDSPQPEEEVEVLDVTSTVKNEGPLSTVQEDVVLEDVNVSSQMSPVPAPLQVVPEVAVVTASSVAVQTPVALKDVVSSAVVGVHSDAGSDRRGEAQMTEAQAKIYVADQVRRWERDESERCVPPNIKYDWPQVRLDPKSFLSAALNTSEYVKRRTTMPVQAAAWISEMQVQRSTFGTAHDLTAILIPPEMFSPRECIAVLQTLLFEAGFGFVNLVPGWFRTRVGKVPAEMVREVVGKLLQFLAVEMIEWRQFVQHVEEIRVQLAIHRSTKDPYVATFLLLEDGSRDEDEGLLLTDDEATLLGGEFVLKLKMAGLRKVQSPRRPSAEPESKRPQHHPPRPSSIPSPLSLQSFPSSTVSNQTGVGMEGSVASSWNASSEPSSRSNRSLFGTSAGSDESLPSATSGSLTSRDSSTDTSGWSSGRDAGFHMTYVSPVAVAMTAQASGVDAQADAGLGTFVVHGLTSPVQTQITPGDVVMTESGRPVVHARKAEAPVGDRVCRRREEPSSPSDESDSGDRRRRSGSRRPRRSRSRSPSRHSIRSSRSGRSRRSNASSMSASSGATQVALNTMHQVQDAVSRMEKAQGITLERLGLSLKQELGRMVEAQLKDVAPKPEPVQFPQEAVLDRPVADHLEATLAENIRLERERAETMLAQYRAEAEARQAEEAQRMAAAMAALQQELRALRVNHAQEQETAKNVQKFLTGQLRNARATVSQSQGTPATSGPDSATQVQLDTGRATLHPESSQTQSGVNMGHVRHDVKNSDEFFATQLQATIQKPSAVRLTRGTSTKAGEALATVKTESPSGDPNTFSSGKNVKPSSRRRSESRPEHKKSESRRDRDRKSERRRGDPSDSDPSSSSSDDSSDSDDSSSFEETMPAVMGKDSRGDSTVFTFRPYVNASSLEDFNEKAPLTTRTRWLERFQSIAAQGGWTDRNKAAEFKLKLSSSVRDWRSNLPPKTRRNWRRFLKAFRSMYCKAKIPDPERYYTMFQKKSETPLEFFYRLNRTADKADIDFRTKGRYRESHIKIFTKRLLDSRHRSTLQGQKMSSLKELEFVLKQHEDLARDDDTEVQPTRTRDFRADNVPRDRFRPNRTGRAYVVQDEDDSDNNEDKQVRFQEEVEEVPDRASTPSAAAAPSEVPVEDTSREGLTSKQDFSEAVFRVMENSGWRPPPPDFRTDSRTPRFGNPNASQFCSSCKGFVHSAGNCWANIKCDRCHRTGHPTRVCKTLPYSYCNKFHQGECEEWKVFQNIKDLARQGALQGLPSSIQAHLLEGDASSGEKQLN